MVGGGLSDLTGFVLNLLALSLNEVGRPLDVIRGLAREARNRIRTPVKLFVNYCCSFGGSLPKRVSTTCF